MTKHARYNVRNSSYYGKNKLKELFVKRRRQNDISNWGNVTNSKFEI